MVDDMNVGKIFYNDDGILNRNKLKESWIKKKLPNLYNSVLEFNTMDDISFSQKIWHYINDLKSYPLCEYCNKLNSRWQSFSSGYKDGCSRSCAIQLSRPKGIETRRKNTLEKHGVDHTSQLESVKEKSKATNIERYGGVAPACDISILSKIKETNIERYGVEFPLQSGEIYDKFKSTLVERYGVDSIMKCDLMKERVRKSNLVKYGVVSYSMTDEFKHNIRESHMKDSLKRISEMDISVDVIGYMGDMFEISCNNCGGVSEIRRSAFYLRVHRYNSDPCVICNPLYDNFVSNMERELSEYLQSMGINVINSYRDHIKEIDIYLPDYNIGIEMNGNYWHSELFKDKNYHQEKSLYFKNLGIDILHVWESDWKFKEDIVKSIILSKLGKSSEVIYARKCKIVSLTNKETIDFLKENHLQGYTNSKVCLGLVYNDELVSLMTFTPSKNRHIRNGDYWELVRFCNRLNSTVIGGAQRLFSSFRKDYDHSIISYSKFDYSSMDNNIYLKLGFTLDKLTGPGYYWCKGIERHYRFNFRKSKLVKDGYDPKLTESQIMYDRGYVKSWDSGNLRFTIG